MIVYIVIVCILLLMFLAGSSLYKSDMGQVQEESKINKICYPAVLFWLTKSGYLGWDSTRRRIETVQMLHPGENAREIQLSEICHKISILYLILLSVSILCIFIQSGSNIRELKSVIFTRPTAGSIDANEELTVILREDSLETKERKSFVISAREYRPDEIEQFRENVKQQLSQYVKGENVTLDSVTSDLQLVDRIPENPFKISWDVSGQEIIDENGHLHNKGIKQKELVTIRACLSYQKEEEYLDVYVGVEPYQWTWSEQALQEFDEYMNKLNSKTETLETYKLPNHIGDIDISYERKVVDRAKKVFCVGILLCGMLYVYWSQDIKKKKKEYIDQCQRCYPGMVSKLTLLVGAGMTVKGAWQRMVNDYSKERKCHNGQLLYVYEEMLITWNEMLNGVTEYEAFSRFGKRIQLRCYMRLSSLITQNLKKGTKGFLVQLEAEVREAQEERKQIARQLGEEAGTKMLFPMLIMLIIVLVIVMVPAFLSFSEGGL